MFKIAVSVFLLMTSFNAVAALVYSAEIDGTNIVLKVHHGGDCKRPKFTLQMGTCLGTTPEQCTVELTPKTFSPNDCAPINYPRVVIPFSDLDIAGERFAKARITIISNGDPVTVILPEKISEVPVPAGNGDFILRPNVRCVLDKNVSILKIDALKKMAEIDAPNKPLSQIKVIDFRTLEILTSPHTFQTTYYLEDGTSVEVNFLEFKKTGGGYRIHASGYMERIGECFRSFNQ